MVLLSTDGKEISAFYSDMDTFTFKDENGKSYDVRNFEIVHTAPYVEKDWF